MNILVVSQYFYPENFRINDVAAALEKMAACPELYREKGRKGRRYFEEHFTLRQFMERLDELIRQLTEADEGTGKR